MPKTTYDRIPAKALTEWHKITAIQYHFNLFSDAENNVF